MDPSAVPGSQNGSTEDVPASTSDLDEFRADEPKVLEQVRSSLRPKMARTEFSLGRSVVEAHGLELSGERIAVCNSYVVGPFRQGTLPTNLLPDPQGDAYLGFTAIPTLSKEEVFVSLTVQPGMLEYYQRVGLLSPETEIIEVDPSPESIHSPGFPHTAPLERLKQTDRSVRAGYFVATFPTEDSRQAALWQESVPVQNYDADYLNNKANFRRDAGDYGFRVLPGLVIENESDLEQVRDLQGTRGWLKLATGSGGDLVRPFNLHDETSLSEARAHIRQAVENAFTAAHFGEKDLMERFWPKEEGTPATVPLVVEQDAGSMGPVLMNASMNVLIKRDGSVELLDCFRQRTGSDGSYQGSERLDIDTLPVALQEEIRQQAHAVFAYAHDHGLRGYAGVDFFVIGGEQSPGVYCTELNARPTMSAVPALTAKKLDLLAEDSRHEHFINTNIHAPDALRSFADFQEVFTVDGIDLTNPSNPTGVTVVPLALRSLFHHTEEGDLACLSASDRAKVLVTAESTEAAWQLLERLEEAGRLRIG